MVRNGGDGWGLGRVGRYTNGDMTDMIANFVCELLMKRMRG